MQGENPLPYPVIEKFATSQGEIAKNVFMLSTRKVYAFEVYGLTWVHQVNQGSSLHRTA